MRRPLALCTANRHQPDGAPCNMDSHDKAPRLAGASLVKLQDTLLKEQ